MTTCISRDADMSVVGGLCWPKVHSFSTRSRNVLETIASFPAEDDSNATPHGPGQCCVAQHKSTVTSSGIVELRFPEETRQARLYTRRSLFRHELAVHLVEGMDAFFLLHAVASTVVAAGVEILLHDLADADVFSLNLVAEG